MNKWVERNTIDTVSDNHHANLRDLTVREDRIQPMNEQFNWYKNQLVHKG